MPIPRSTYRVQLHGGFTFDDLRRLVPYLAELGISHCYCSPIFRAAPGSKHGYDVCDYDCVNPELGGGEGLRRLAAELRAHGLQLLLDFVPNHMGIAGPFNRWWRDVLEQGPASRYATFFDISWWREDAAGRGRVLAPLLPDHYGVLLEQGKIRLEARDGELALVHEEAGYPVRAETYQQILTEAFSEKPCDNPKARFTAVVTESERARRQLESYLEQLNGRPGEPGSFDRLDRIIEGQHYRLTRWQTGAHGANYRRFFAIDTLMGVRVENPEVFTAVHRKLKELIRDGIVAGLRIDHIDGLRDPEAYLRQLQTLATHASGVPEPFYLVVEKILAKNETLPASWPVHGTTGYEFIPTLADLLIARGNETKLDRIYASFTGERGGFDEVVRNKKRLVLRTLFDNTVWTLAHSLLERIYPDRRWRDLTASEIAEALRALLAEFSVYRTYRREGPVSDEDRRQLEQTARRALQHRPEVEPALIEFIRDVLLGDYPEASATPDQRGKLSEWALSVQQYTGAVMAKAVEDTAYYCANRLIALNEVGGDPARFGGDIEDFHLANKKRLAAAPHTLLTTSTHDTKVSEDVRARLYALSEIPDEWQTWIEEWRRLNTRHKTEIDGQLAPSANEEYRLYQTLLGAWPASGEIDDIFRKRIRDYLKKSLSEAKEHTWTLHPNEPWISACDRFVDALLTPGGEFRASFERAARRVARLGLVNSCAQTILKLTVPGVPDIYQGNEGWDYSLVDPDNRREVDYQTLRQALTRKTAFATSTFYQPGPHLKQQLTRTLLQVRKSHPELFSEGSYKPVLATGSLGEHVVAFVRESQDLNMLVAVSRVTGSLVGPPVATVWKDTVLHIEAPASPWRDLFTGHTLSGDVLQVSELFERWPFAVLIAESGEI